MINLTTQSVCATDKLDYWNELVGSTYAGMFVDAKQRDFDAQLSVWQLDKLRMVRPRAKASVINRHMGSQTKATRSTLVMHQVNSGELQLHQRGRSVSLKAGDIVICEAEEHYRFDAPTAHDLLVVEVNREDLSSRIANIDDWIARPISGLAPQVRIFHRFLQSLWLEACRGLRLGLQDPELYSDLLCDMLASAITSGGTDSGGVERDPLFARIEEAVTVGLDDSSLSPSRLAEQLDVPLRTLQAAAARAGVTLGAYIAERRLHRAADLLVRNPEYNVTRVAMECGFQDPSHFSRRFHQAFGISPSQYRQQH